MEREKTPLHESFQDAPNILFCGQQYFIYHNKTYKTRSLSSHPMVRNFLYIVKSWGFFFLHSSIKLTVYNFLRMDGIKIFYLPLQIYTFCVYIDLCKYSIQ